jgi:hypothetical protein
MSLNNLIALIDLPEFQQFSRIDPSAELVDGILIENLINAVSTRFNDETWQKWIKPSVAITEYVSGSGESRLYLKNSPIVGTITAIYYRTSFSSDWQTYIGLWDKDDEMAYLYTLDGAIFGKGDKNWKVSYVYGYDRQDVPADIKEAVCDAVLFKRNQLVMGAHGIQSESLGDKSLSFDFNKMPESWESAVNKYRRYRLA